jgi:hypothetical protein
LKIPYNRFSEKTNIFLPIIKENKDGDKIVEDNDNGDNDENIVVEVMDEIIVIEEH